MEQTIARFILWFMGWLFLSFIIADWIYAEKEDETFAIGGGAICSAILWITVWAATHAGF